MPRLVRGIFTAKYIRRDYHILKVYPHSIIFFCDNPPPVGAWGEVSPWVKREIGAVFV